MPEPRAWMRRLATTLFRPARVENLLTGYTEWVLNDLMLTVPVTGVPQSRCLLPRRFSSAGTFCLAWLNRRPTPNRLAQSWPALLRRYPAAGGVNPPESLTHCMCRSGAVVAGGVKLRHVAPLGRLAELPRLQVRLDAASRRWQGGKHEGQCHATSLPACHSSAHARQRQHDIGGLSGCKLPRATHRVYTARASGSLEVASAGRNWSDTYCSSLANWPRYARCMR